MIHFTLLLYTGTLAVEDHDQLTHATLPPAMYWSVVESQGLHHGLQLAIVEGVLTTPSSIVKGFIDSRSLKRSVLIRVRSHFWLGSDISFLASPGFVHISQSLLLVLAFAGPSAAGLLSLPWLAGFLHAAFAGAAFFFGDMSFAGTSSPLVERTDFALGEVSLHSRGQEQHAHSLCRLCLWS